MKKLWKILCLILCVAITFPFLAACLDEEEPTVDVITYSGATLSGGTVGSTYSASVATATGTDDIKYELVLGYSFPSGITMSSAGAVSGTPLQAVSERVVKVRAFVEDSDDIEAVEAEFTITIAKGAISFSASSLPDATEGMLYNKNIATATAASGVSIGYALKSGSVLPAGLTLSSAGVISGYPAAESEVEGHEFIVVASALSTNSGNYNQAEATFEINVLAGEDDGEPDYTESDVLSFKAIDDLEVGYLPDGTVGVPYEAIIRADGTAPQNISYSYGFSGTGFPVGISMDEFGVVSGTPLDSTIGENKQDKEKVLSFSVTARADGFDSITRTFYLRVIDPPVETDKFHAALLDLTHYSGAGWSSNDSGLNMLHIKDTGDIGAYLGYMHSTGVVIEFNIYSSAETTGNLSIRVASEVGEHTFDDDMYVIKVNGGKVNYEPFTTGDDDMTAADSLCAPFDVIEIGEIDLIEGWNTITFEMQDNEFLSEGRTGSLEFDYLQIETDAVLSWNPKTYNLVIRGVVTD